MDFQVRHLSFRGVPFLIACLPDPLHDSTFIFEDESSVRERDWTVREGDVVLDIGAAYGSYTLTALAMGASMVYAWSPRQVPGDPKDADFLRKSLELNGWSDRCVIYESGLYDRPGILDAEPLKLPRLLGPSDIPSPSSIRVGRLDDWMAEVAPGRVDWMKLDVEGAEVQVLDGGSNLIRTLLPKIQVENHLFMRSDMCDLVRDSVLSLGPYREISTVPYHSVSHSLYSAR